MVNLTIYLLHTMLFLTSDLSKQDNFFLPQVVYTILEPLTPHYSGVQISMPPCSLVKLMLYINLLLLYREGWRAVQAARSVPASQDRGPSCLSGPLLLLQEEEQERQEETHCLREGGSEGKSYAV